MESERDEPPEERVCEWRGCGGPVLVHKEGGGWCVEHAGDEMLPSLVYGPLGSCEHCGAGSAFWTTDLETPMHSKCRRAWVSGQRGSPTKKRLGAYGRRG